MNTDQTRRDLSLEVSRREGGPEKLQGMKGFSFHGKCGKVEKETVPSFFVGFECIHTISYYGFMLEDTSNTEFALYKSYNIKFINQYEVCDGVCI